MVRIGKVPWPIGKARETSIRDKLLMYTVSPIASAITPDVMTKINDCEGELMKSSHLPDRKMKENSSMEPTHRRNTLIDRISILVVRNLFIVLLPAQHRAVSKAAPTPSMSFSFLKSGG